MAAKEVRIWPAEDAEHIASPIMSEFHPHLAGARILFLFTNQERKKQGYVVLGTAQKASSILRYLSSGQEKNIVEGAAFIILISFDEWNILSDEQRIALVDHELSHCRLSEKGEWKIIGHDVEEFIGVIERHGLWRPEVKYMAEAIHQLRLDIPEPEKVLVGVK